MTFSSGDGKTMDDAVNRAKPISEFNTVLVFPPQWTPQNPHNAITSIAGHVRKAGGKILLKDLNVEYYDYVLTPEYLRYTINKVNMNYGFLVTQAGIKTLLNDNSFEFQVEAKRILEMEKFFNENIELIEKLPDLILDAKETLRDSRRFYNPNLLVDAFYHIDKALELVSLPYHPARFTFNSFEQPHCMLATHHLIQHAGDKSNNMFYEFFEDKIPEILSMKPDLIGISINSFSQVLPGLTLAGLLMKRIPENVKINIGGNFFTRVKDTLLKRPEFFEAFCHSLSMNEGEEQVLILIKELAAGRGYEDVPEILYHVPGVDDEKGTVHYTFKQDPIRINDLAFQDMSGLPLDLYFTPEIVLCLRSSKGCYWGKCTFCDTDFGVKKDIKNIDRLIEEIKYLRDTFGVRHFEFIDESIKPSYMREMAERFIAEDLGISWFSNGRLEESFTADLLQLLHKAGLSMVLWGFESGCDRILDLINKGVDKVKRYDILRDSHEAGIWNFAYVFFGFPTETSEEAMETINALVDHNDIIDSYGRSVFTLGKHSLLCVDAEKYGIFDVVEDSEELSTILEYRTTTGMTDPEIDQMSRDCTKICSKAYDYNLWYFLRYRENIHLYLAKFGKEYIRNFKVQWVAPDNMQVL
jgi:anaerobic magnesium-protoporphyrin IX monomethyl ester cyclase